MAPDCVILKKFLTKAIRIITIYLNGTIEGPEYSKMSSQHPFSERHWYVVYSKPHKESSAKFHISAKGLEVFFPRLSLPRNTKRANPVIALFPNYLFVRLNIESEEYGYVSWSPGVNRIVGFNGYPTPIDDEVLNFLQSRSDSEGIIPAESNLRRGQEVRITEGPLSGLLGIIREPPTAKGRVKVLLTLLNRDAAVDLPLDFVETSWIAANAETGTRKF
jgi:transcription elongation factor/antiterminator RfaH